jgi:hypothetical protein
MPLHKADYYVVPAQLICFSVSFILGVFTLATHGALTEILNKMKDAFFITGTTLLSIKLTRDGWEMPAAGLIILAIGWAVVFAATDFFGQKAGIEMLSSAFYFIFPAMILITFYKPFYLWIKILCWICVFNFLFALIKKIYYPQLIFNVIIIALNILIIHIVSMAWAFYFFLKHKKEKSRNISN